MISKSTFGRTEFSSDSQTESEKVVHDSVILSNNGQMIPLDNLRLSRCRKHGATILMAAIRYDEFKLAEVRLQRAK
jgi:hypothetical protein